MSSASRAALAPIRNQIDVTFEFFPPRTRAADARLWQCIDMLAPVGPNFVSVTYGADGHSRAQTVETVEKLVNNTQLPVAAHITAADASCDSLHQILDVYHALGLRHLVALRGDAPGHARSFVPHPHGYANALELVRGIRSRYDFDISVAAYPEGHPEAHSQSQALDYLKAKIDAGANRAITQFFFEAQTYLRFADAARAAGITAAIVPGILPITDFARVRGFAERCATQVPKWIGQLFEGLDDDPKTRELVALAIAVEQCAELMDNGVRTFHFYTLNRGDLTRAICRALRFRPQRARRRHNARDLMELVVAS